MGLSEEISPTYQPLMSAEVPNPPVTGTLDIEGVVDFFNFLLKSQRPWAYK